MSYTLMILLTYTSIYVVVMIVTNDEYTPRAEPTVQLFERCYFVWDVVQYLNS